MLIWNSTIIYSTMIVVYRILCVKSYLSQSCISSQKLASYFQAYFSLWMKCLLCTLINLVLTDKVPPATSTTLSPYPHSTCWLSSPWVSHGVMFPSCFFYSKWNERNLNKNSSTAWHTSSLFSSSPFPIYTSYCYLSYNHLPTFCCLSIIYKCRYTSKYI